MLFRLANRYRGYLGSSMHLTLLRRERRRSILDRARPHAYTQLSLDHSGCTGGLSQKPIDALSPRRSEPVGTRGVNWLLTQDRKSTRLNSSHGYISYAVFCLKK